jgi:hypothetical protein
MRHIPRDGRGLLIPRPCIFKNGCPKLGQNEGLGSGAEAFGSKASSRHDPRLFDECLDWLRKHGSLIPIQRLKTPHEDSGLGDSAVLAAMADWLVTEGRQS